MCTKGRKIERDTNNNNNTTSFSEKIYLQYEHEIELTARFNESILTRKCNPVIPTIKPMTIFVAPKAKHRIQK